MDHPAETQVGRVVERPGAVDHFEHANAGKSVQHPGKPCGRGFVGGINECGMTGVDDDEGAKPGNALDAGWSEVSTMRSAPALVPVSTVRVSVQRTPEASVQVRVVVVRVGVGWAAVAWARSLRMSSLPAPGHPPASRRETRRAQGEQGRRGDAWAACIAVVLLLNRKCNWLTTLKGLGAVAAKSAQFRDGAKGAAG
jgi:hypothetical protein